MPVVFEKKFRDDPSAQIAPREDGAVPFAVDDAGLGDMVMAMGFMEGYRASGVPSWIATSRPEHTSLLRAFGEEASSDSHGSVRMGGRSSFYGPWLKGGCETHTMIEWIRESLPGRPEWITPTLKLGADVDAWATDVSTTTDLEQSNEFLRQQSGPPVLLFPEANYGTRTSPVSYWVDLAWELRHRGLRSIVMLRDGTGAKAYPLTLTGHALEHVAALISKAQLVIGQDSGPAHIAGAIGTPTLALCGPTRNMFTQYPSVLELHAGREAVSCTGCWFNVDKGYRSACDFGCRGLASITPEEILDVIDQLPQPEGFLRPRVGDQSRTTVRPTCGVPRALVGVVRSPAGSVRCVRRMGLDGERDYPPGLLGDGRPGVRWVLDEPSVGGDGDA